MASNTRLKQLSSFYSCYDFSLCSVCQGILRSYQPEFPGGWCGCVSWEKRKWKRGYCGTVFSEFTFSAHQVYYVVPESAPFHPVFPKLGKSRMALYLHVFEDFWILGLKCLLRMEHTEQWRFSDTKRSCRKGHTKRSYRKGHGSGKSFVSSWFCKEDYKFFPLS